MLKQVFAKYMSNDAGEKINKIQIFKLQQWSGGKEVVRVNLYTLIPY